jgi:hypothetical protein
LANEKSSKESRPLRKHEQIKYLTPSIVVRSISDKEKEGTSERTPSFKISSPIITTHLKIEVTCIGCNIIDTMVAK